MSVFKRNLVTFLLICLAACSEPIVISPDAALPDGSRYEGELKLGVLHGQGTLVYSDSSYYKGEFSDGRFHGQGKFVYSSGAEYEGEFHEGKYHGNGSFDDGDNGLYVGEFSKGEYHGIGKHTLKTGAIYEGEFKQGFYDGKGRYSQDEYYYDGDFERGVFSGSGTYKVYDGATYTGEVSNWLAEGEGEKITEDDETISGEFVTGYVSGSGKIVNSDGSYYEGEFSYDKPEGEGKWVYANGDVFEGEFSYGSRYGLGTLTRSEPAENESATLTGKWSGDKLLHNTETGERRYDQSGIALEHHQKNLELAVSKLSSGKNGETDIYFLGVAGDGSQSVFKREIEFISPLIQSSYSAQGRSLVLINHHDTAAQYPLATNRSIATALNGIAESMDTEHDILIAYLTSHGSKEHEFSLNHDSIKLSNIAAEELANTIKQSQIKWKVIIISACYAGGFIPALKDDHTLIITAADAKSRSFGCSEEAEMTYFGSAFFKETLATNKSISLPDAFELAKERVTKWEEEQEKSPSNPMMHAPDAIVNKLAEWRAEANHTSEQ